jgi:monothiol glutaredoxin
MDKPKIVAYLKPWCGWSRGVRAVFEKYGLEFEDRDIIGSPENRIEMIQKSGQELSPCVEVNGHMLADVSGEEVESWMIAQGLIVPSDAPTSAPTNAACSDAEHAAQATAMQAGTIKFYPRP